MTAPLRLTDRKREAIVQAAIAEFRANGFDVTSMDKIAATAEVSKRTVYNHFPSKEELFAEILHQLWARAVGQADTAYYPDRPLRDQLRALLKTKMQTMSDESFLDLARVVTAATIHSPERAQNMVKRMSELEKPFNGWITAAQADGRLKTVEPDFAAHQVYGLLKSFAFWPQITKGSPPLPSAMQSRVIESTLDLFLGWYEITPSADR